MRNASLKRGKASRLRISVWRSSGGPNHTPRTYCNVRIYWKRTLLALWLLSQMLGFALPSLSSPAKHGPLFCPAWGHNQQNGYNAGAHSCVAYDAELLCVTTEGLSDS